MGGMQGNYHAMYVVQRKAMQDAVRFRPSPCGLQCRYLRAQAIMRVEHACTEEIERGHAYQRKAMP